MKFKHLQPVILVLLFIFQSTGTQAASVTGTIKYEGKVPSFRPIKMDADPICLTHHTGPVLPQTLILGEGQTMANVFVYVKKGVSSKNHPAPTEPFILDQKGCEYTPHVLGIMVGQPLKILNPDGTLHNVHAIPKVNKEFNMAMPKFRQELSYTFDKPEFMFPIKCDVHPWMGAWIAVMDHPFFNVTKIDGIYTIDNLPAGEYTLAAWHEKLGEQTFDVKLGEGQAETLDITFSRPDKGEE